MWHLSIFFRANFEYYLIKVLSFLRHISFKRLHTTLEIWNRKLQCNSSLSPLWKSDYIECYINVRTYYIELCILCAKILSNKYFLRVSSVWLTSELNRLTLFGCDQIFNYISFKLKRKKNWERNKCYQLLCILKDGSLYLYSVPDARKK